jgi:hypothetical protein
MLRHDIWARKGKALRGKITCFGLDESSHRSEALLNVFFIDRGGSDTATTAR